MRGLLRRPAVAFVLGALVVAAAFAGRAAQASLSGDVVNACFKPSNGTLYLIGGDSGRTSCQPGDVPISWNTQGLQGPPGPPGEQGAPGEKGDKGDPGTFSGTFASPNGQYRLTVADDGIRLEGPLGFVRITGSGVAVNSALALTLQGATTLTAQAGGPLSVSGFPVTLNGTGCGVLRRTDVNPAIGSDGGAVLLSPGSPTVFTAC